MKKIAFLVFLLAACVATGRAQESRQDISLSGSALIEPFMASSTTVEVNSTTGVRRVGQLPLYAHAVERARSQLRHYLPEQHWVLRQPRPLQDFDTHPGDFGRVTSSPLSSRTGTPLWRPVRRGSSSCPSSTPGTTTLDAKQQTEVGGLFGAGFAYEISPSFDIRAEYRGYVTKVPTFGDSEFTTNRWYEISVPTIGVAYHF